MFGKRPQRFAIVLGLAATALACSDLPTSVDLSVPESAVARRSPKGKAGKVKPKPGGPQRGGPPHQMVHVVGRVVSLAEDVAVTKVIGRKGGKIKIREAGFTLTVPRGALDANVSITVRALAGDLIGYEFQPHGLTFNVPVKAEQKAHTLNVPTSRQGSGHRLRGAYFSGPLDSQVEALELLDLVEEIVLTGRKWSFLISHFSGYVIATD
jgi:hypothetical protein